MAGKTACQHRELLQECSPWAVEAGFERPDAVKRLAAATKTGRNPLSAGGKSAKMVKKLSQDVAEQLSPSFPGPLLLPKDELNWDPDYPPQSFRSWLVEIERNKVTSERNTLYVAAPPIVTPSVAFMKTWAQPATAAPRKLDKLDPPSANASLQYLSAFYHGLPVKFLPGQLRFVPWTEPPQRSRLRGHHEYVGLALNDICTRVRTREAPDRKFKGQLNLNDVLDAAIEMLPDDAYSVVLLMDFDMYEDDDDDFCCGRAYGGSRVCVVSSARYHPALDVDENIDHDHILCAVEGLEPKEHIKSVHETVDSPLQQAVAATRKVYTSLTIEEQSGLWFSRVARTLVHELGHCFGIDHCIYYACNMQGTSGIAEDVRQPPYLCPICLEKVAYAIACELQARDQTGKEEYIKERYKATAEFCETWKHVDLFAAYSAWIRARLQQLSV
ncbi:hypothetical protein F4803DRAFT_576357 [Xylaria telfairii]|nr:hypothetical protein F4803DRAFT_576357 [Xylaria telfairii]